MTSPRFLTAEEVASLWAAAGRTREPVRDRAIIAILADAGPTRGELTSLARSDFDWQDGILAIGHGEDRREIRLGQTAIDAFEPLVAVNGPRLSPLLRNCHGQPVTERTVHELLLRLGRAAGLALHPTCRTTRRGWIHALLGSMPMEVVARLAGHHPQRVRRVTCEEALAAQYRPGWRSPLDAALGASAAETLRRVA